MIRKRLKQIDRVVNVVAPVLMWIAGAVLVANAVFGIWGVAEIASEPRVFLFVNGVLIWSAGTLARSYQKEASRLQTQLRRDGRERQRCAKIAGEPADE